MKAVPPSIYPLILWSCLHFSLCLFYIFITSWGLRLSGVEGGVWCCQAPPPPGGVFAEEQCGLLAPFSFLPHLHSSSQDSQEALTGVLPPSRVYSDT